MSNGKHTHTERIVIGRGFNMESKAFGEAKSKNLQAIKQLQMDIAMSFCVDFEMQIDSAPIAGEPMVDFEIFDCKTGD